MAALSIWMIGSSATAGVLTPPSEPMVTLPGGVPPQAPTLGLVAPAKSDRLLNMRVMYDIRNKPEWKKRHEEFEDPSSPLHHKFWTTQESRELNKPPATWFDQVGSWLTAQGFKVTAYYPNFMGIQFTGTVAEVDRAFRVKIMSTSDGTHYGPLADPMIPVRFQGTILGILGLDNLSGASPAAAASAPTLPAR
jgi:subtilase family serine protease